MKGWIKNVDYKEWEPEAKWSGEEFDEEVEWKGTTMIEEQ